MGEVLTNHPKMIERWAYRYISIGKKEGPEAARAWAYSFLNESCYDELKIKVVELLRNEA